MSDVQQEPAAITSDSALAKLSATLWAAATEAAGPERLLTAATEHVAQQTACPYVAVVRGRKGRWEVLEAAGESPRQLPEDLLGDALDQGRAVSRKRWWAVPLQPHGDANEVLVLRTKHSSKLTEDQVRAVARLVHRTLSAARQRHQQMRRIERLEAILEIAAQWNQNRDLDSLLVEMAETSTRLLGAERASIFLWDRPNRRLVGRPALGVEGGELQIPDDRGVVGQVVQTGQPRRVDADDAADQQEIDRAVDQQLAFQTRSLLCVPLRGRSGQLFGAFEMINKRDGNFTDEDEAALAELATHAAIALENTQELQRLLQTRSQMADLAAQGVQLIGQCPAIEALRSTVSRVADTDLAILILGENGTGKEVVSQLIHYLSRRRNEPLVAVNCAALTETLLESELFGHEKGAFTDAHESRPGKFELASGGTLFLDEIGDMSLSGQAKLLRVLEEKVVVRVGGSRPIHTDARVIAATNRDLAQLVREKKFREDLFFRLNVVTLELPPLRDRGDDILLLAEHFLHSFCAKAGRQPPRFTAAAKKRLLGHSWPGNIRELRNLMERLAYLSQGDRIDAADLAFILSPESESPGLLSMNLPLTEATRQFQIQYIQRQIDRARGNMTEAAKLLGLHRSNLYRKMHQLGMQTDQS